ncbi:acetaldehyde dehydrogenase (acetylating) [Shewanella woodyi]|uniref:Acetaldehyde dehydrogenase n=1 Tax=Shewanella woodyi (strain ATCC 51908 / MS32) TaxID=392500 RepID=ACDH_SHEWM|nr:RecName: Full=Acetaldehyde dehydrogenase; AltName: Full=Acetaldehyde dehydrogenase [acetylating] [Shewanella woodyi ATCC 51908]
MVNKKINIALIGSGNIGTDLMIKALRSSTLNPVWMVGIDENSDGLKRAKALGLKTTHLGIDELLTHIEADNIQIAFDATSAYVHEENNRKLQSKGVKVIDLTPAAIGPYCIPPVNLESLLSQTENQTQINDGSISGNLNMVTCGGQATIPIIAAISRVQSVDYGEIVATIASKSAGPGTRKNIDEFTRTTADAIEQIGGARQGKAIIVMNPAEPPLMMRDTVHCLTQDEPDVEAITASVLSMIEQVQEYVPGYRLKNGPVFDGNRVSVFLEVAGLGDYLPEYAGNLDIMTSAALCTGEMLARNLRSNMSVKDSHH